MPYSWKVLQQNPHIKERLGKTNQTKTMEDNPSIKEIAEAFSTVMGEGISGEEVNLIQDIQLPDEVEEVIEEEDTLVADQNEV